MKEGPLQNIGPPLLLAQSSEVYSNKCPFVAAVEHTYAITIKWV